MKKVFEIFSILLVAFAITSCDLEEVTPKEENEDSEWDNQTGLDTDIEEEEYKSVPSELSMAIIGDVVLTDAVNLREYMPPINSQGQYGTCTSWSTGYYARTIINARENGLTKSDLEDMENVFSPLDIYLSIDHSANCGGSAIATAFTTMQSRGIARFSEVPYENLNNCSQASPASSSQYTRGKIDHFRRLELKPDEFKTQLQKGNPIAVGCDTGDETQAYRDGIMMNDNGDGNGGHAMCVVGYDDNKGPNGAILIANSWDTWWGEDGFMWVDYDFFFSGRYCKYAYVLEADKGAAPIIDENQIDANQLVNGYDLLALTLEDRVGDVNTGPRDRSIQYNVFNKGDQTISASKDWNIMYYYYNAFDPEGDFGVLFYDYYTDDVSDVASKGESGDFNDVNVAMEKYGTWNWWNYIDIPAGYSVGKALDGSEADMIFDYEIPAALNGKYYFVLCADGFQNVDEEYEQNNFLFFTGENRKPIEISNGIIQSLSTKSTGTKRTASYTDELKKANPNTYSVEEIAQLIDYQKSEGLLEAKAQTFLKSASNNHATKRLVRK